LYMIRRIVLTVLMLFLLLAAGLTMAIWIFRHPTPVEFQRATASQPVRLPRDEAAHFDAQTEWWYYTGFLSGEDDQRYGFELVFFKVYVPQHLRMGNLLPIHWVTNPLYFAHFALSDEAAQEHTFFEQVNMPAFWDAGARSDRFEVRNGSWRAWGSNGAHHLRASGGRYRLRLDLESVKSPVLHGPEEVGVVDMGRAGTSYYYSRPELRGVGLLYVDGDRQLVEATAWMDHQWGSWQSHGGYAGWDWFSLRLENGCHVMLFEFRDDGGVVQPGSSGTWIAADGSTQHLMADDYSLEVLERWTSPTTGAAYPIKWHLTLPDHDTDVTVAATFPEQEMVIQLGPIYWEGSVIVDGTVHGEGFVEMTGYAGGGP
jgi:predicted secreted hydrolase